MAKKKVMVADNEVVQWDDGGQTPVRFTRTTEDEVKPIRTFDTGATRDTDEGKPEYSGFLAPEVLIEFGKYMHRHRIQSDGSLRASDNWKKGIPTDAYMESLLRHIIDVWSHHQMLKEIANSFDLNEQEVREGMKESLCASMFNVMGYLYEILKKERQDFEDSV